MRGDATAEQRFEALLDMNDENEREDTSRSSNRHHCRDDSRAHDATVMMAFYRHNRAQLDVREQRDSEGSTRELKVQKNGRPERLCLISFVCKGVFVRLARCSFSRS